MARTGDLVPSRMRKGKPLPRYLIQLSQVLVMRDAILPAHHVAWTRTAGRVVRAGSIHTERLVPLLSSWGTRRE
jgi:hypothetical protein